MNCALFSVCRFFILQRPSRIAPVLLILLTIASTSAFKTRLGGTAGIKLPMSLRQTIQLPEKLVIGYANWNQCDDLIVRAVEQGVNVVMWFSINLVASPETGKPMITNGPDMDSVADVVAKITELGFTDTVHLISIGGWNAPHVDTSNSAEDIYEYFHYWNTHVAARPEKGFFGFHGFDWDIEGNDDPHSPYNHFTVECLDAMGKISQLAKARDNYIVSMAPAESYLDPTNGYFDRSLLHEYEEWVPVIGSFAYHGSNTYAYLLERYGTFNREQLQRTGPATEQNIGKDVVADEETFDFVTIQLYEGYSHAEYNITQNTKGLAAAGRKQIEEYESCEAADRYLLNFVKSLVNGWSIDFSGDRELRYPYHRVLQLPASRIVVGLANGWAGDGKFLLLYPEQVQRGYEVMQEAGVAPRGFAFWNIKDEGMCSPLRPEQPVWMAAGLNSFLQTRPPKGELK